MHHRSHYQARGSAYRGGGGVCIQGKREVCIRRKGSLYRGKGGESASGGGRGVCIGGQGGLYSGGGQTPPTRTRKVGSMYPTGMLSCMKSICSLWKGLNAIVTK